MTSSPVLRASRRRSLLAALAIATLPVLGCTGSASSDLGPVDFAGADLTGVDLTGFPQPGDAGVMVTPTAAATVIVEPGDSGAGLLAAISGAATSVHMTMYLLSDNGIINALIARKNAGKEVEVLLNHTFPAGGGSSSSVYGQLQGAGVSVRYAPSTYQYTHEKCVILDGATAWIMTMNATGSAPTQNREYLAVDTDADDVAEAEAIFQADWAGQSITPSGKLLVSPVDAEPKLVALIDKATQTVSLEGEVLSASSIATALGRADKRGVTVHIVLSDQAPTSAQSTVLSELKAAGIAVHALHSPYVHAKAIVVDGVLAYVGSENFTVNSLENNRELGLILGTKSEVDKVSSTIEADYAAGSTL